MARAGLTIDTQTLWDQLAALAHHLTPTHDALHAVVLTAPVLGADETRWPLLVAAIRAWCVAHPVLPESALGKAIRYTLDLWPGLTAFLTEPALPLDTNHVERGMRALAVGRKNHYGSRSERGTRVAALFYSLIESAKLVGLEPGAYLAEATRRAIDTPGTVPLPAAPRSPSTLTHRQRVGRRSRAWFCVPKEPFPGAVPVRPATPPCRLT
jgi:hypothetical protein